MTSSRNNPLRVKRIYDAPAKDDGIRILMDGIWPRGIKKENAHLDAWLKELAPTKELRSWFAHDPAKWREFRARYHAYLENDESAQAALRSLRERWRKGPVTLLFAAKDAEHNNAVALAEFLTKRRAETQDLWVRRCGMAARNHPQSSSGGGLFRHRLEGCRAGARGSGTRSSQPEIRFAGRTLRRMALRIN